MSDIISDWNEHKFTPSCAVDNDETLCSECMIPKREHPGWSEKARASVIETSEQLEALLRRRGWQR
jgi:hypothetical protein